MGKVLKEFERGWAGQVSRSKDDVIISLKNAANAVIPFGSPVFMKPGDAGVKLFNAAQHTAANFVGFAVRIPDKTPETYGSALAEYPRNGTVDILVRGSVVVPVVTATRAADKLYINKSDSTLTAVAGAEGTTVALPNVTIRSPRDADGRAEAVVRTRNVL